MEKENLISVLQELTSLFECYKHLEEWSKTPNNYEAASAGQFLIYNRMHDIIGDNAIWAIVGTNEPYPIEDYVHNVLQDTPEYITRLNKYISSK